MKKLVGITFRRQCKVYTFDSKELELKRGDKVVVETVQGKELGTVVLPTYEAEDEKVPEDLKSVDRVATTEDLEKQRQNEEQEKNAIGIAKEKINAHGLPMKLIRAEYTFDKSKLTLFFISDGRVDFRELVKDLAGTFRTRIELRQIGPRDETRLVGGLGVCGRELCCASWLSNFEPVSIKMAKAQNLSLNAEKISGMCNHLMCCLRNEIDTYEYLNAALPKIGWKVHTMDGRTGVVKAVNVLKQRVTVLFEDKNDSFTQEEFAVAELKFKRENPEEEKISEEPQVEIVEELEEEVETVTICEDSEEVTAAENANQKEGKPERNPQDKEQKNSNQKKHPKNKKFWKNRRKPKGNKDNANAGSRENKEN